LAAIRSPQTAIVAFLAIVFFRAVPLLKLIAGIVAIMSRDKRSRAERALDVLRALRPDQPPVAGIMVSSPDRVLPDGKSGSLLPFFRRNGQLPPGGSP
jgi:hypothetical protein